MTTTTNVPSMPTATSSSSGGGSKSIGYYRNRGSSRYESWYGNSLNGGTIGTGVIAINTLIVVPFLVGRAITIDNLGVWVSAGGSAGSVVSLGIYDNVSDDDPYPNALKANPGQIPSTSSGVLAQDPL